MMEAGQEGGAGWGCPCVLPSWENAENMALDLNH